jgi:hypothetical protein
MFLRSLFSKSYSISSPLIITHVKQRHSDHLIPIENIEPDLKKEIAQSQYQVGSAIMSNPHSIVLSERCYYDLTPKIYHDAVTKGEPLYRSIQDTFLIGFPSSFSDMTPLQTNLLIEHGAPKILFYLGLITHVYKTMNNAEYEFLVETFRYGKMHDDLIYRQREEQAIHWARIASITSGNNNVLLVYGAAHDFETVIAKYVKQNITFYKNIYTTKPIADDENKRIIAGIYPSEIIYADELKHPSKTDSPLTQRMT